MKVVLVILAAIVMACFALEVVSRAVGRRGRERVGKMSPEGRFRYQNDMSKAQLG